MKVLAIALAALTLAASSMVWAAPQSEEAKTPELSPAQKVERDVVVSYDEFKKLTSYHTEAIRIMRPGDAYWHVIYLVADKPEKRGQTSYEVYVETNYKSNNFIGYFQAFDNTGKKLPFEKITHSVDNCEGARCVLSETYSIPLTKQYLDAAVKRKSTSFKVQGRNDAMVFDLEGDLFRGFLAALKKSLPAN